MEMLCDTEKFLAPEYTVRGEMDKRLTSLLCGLLKTLLRESVAQPLYSLRKIQIEMIWQWYCDKKSNVLDFVIGKERERQGSQQAAVPAPQQPSSPLKLQNSVAATSPEQPTDDQVSRGAATIVRTDSSLTTSAAGSPTSSKFASKLERVIQGQWHATAAVADASRTGVTDLTFQENATRATEEAAIQKKLCIYKKRNLVKADKMRQEIQQQAQSTDVRVVMTKDSKTRQKKMTDAKSQNLQLSMRHGPSGPAPYFHVPAVAPTYSPSDGQQSDGAGSSSSNEQVLAEAHRKYLAFLTRKLAEENDVKNFNDMMVLFAGNQARLREESFRRMEADRYASLVVGKAGNITQRPPLRFNTPEAQGQPQRPPASISAGGDTAWAEKLGYTMYRGPQTTLSPYDVRTPSRLDTARLQQMANTIATPDDAAAEVRARLGLMNPDSRNLVTTGCGGAAGALDVVLAPDAKVTPVIPQLHIPVRELLFMSSDPDASIPSVSQLAQMAVVERLRENFAFAVTMTGKRCYMPRGKIEAAMLTPDDRPHDECLRLLPVYGEFLPRAYEGAPPGSRPQTAPSKKKKK
jgi:hypothetical protein